MAELYRIPVGDICKDVAELARRLNVAERRLPADQRRHWRAVTALNLFYQQQYANPLAQQSYGRGLFG